MVRYKWIRIRKPGGGTRLQKVRVLANGKYRFVKNTTKTRKKRKKKTTTRRKTTRRKSVRKKKKTRRRKKSFWDF